MTLWTHCTELSGERVVYVSVTAMLALAEHDSNAHKRFSFHPKITYKHTWDNCGNPVID